MEKRIEKSIRSENIEDNPLYNYLIDKIDEREQSIRKMDDDDVLVGWQKLKDLYNQDLNSLKADLKEVLKEYKK